MHTQTLQQPPLPLPLPTILCPQGVVCLRGSTEAGVVGRRDILSSGWPHSPLS